MKGFGNESWDKSHHLGNPTNSSAATKCLLRWGCSPIQSWGRSSQSFLVQCSQVGLSLILYLCPTIRVPLFPTSIIASPHIQALGLGLSFRYAGSFQVAFKAFLTNYSCYQLKTLSLAFSSYTVPLFIFQEKPCDSRHLGDQSPLRSMSCPPADFQG